MDCAVQEQQRPVWRRDACGRARCIRFTRGADPPKAMGLVRSVASKETRSSAVADEPTDAAAL